jgi:acetate kinase
VQIREQVSAAFGFLGVRLDHQANAAVSNDADISAQDAAVRVLRLTAREDLAVLTEVKRLL